MNCVYVSVRYGPDHYGFSFRRCLVASVPWCDRNVSSTSNIKHCDVFLSYRFGKNRTIAGNRINSAMWPMSASTNGKTPLKIFDNGTSGAMPEMT